jgi:hypothetical protein
MINKNWILIKFIIFIWVSVLAIVKRVSNIRFTLTPMLGESDLLERQIGIGMKFSKEKKGLGI